MPTAQPRYMVTDTGALAQALDVAQLLWPDIPRGGAAVTRLAAAGAKALERDANARVAAVHALEAFGDVYYPGCLEDLHGEWPI